MKKYTHLVGQGAEQGPVEATGPEERGIQEVGPRGSGDHRDALPALDSVQLGEQLVHHAVSHPGAVVSSSIPIRASLIVA